MNCFCTPPPCPNTPTHNSDPCEWAEYACWIIRYGRPEFYNEQRFTLPDGRRLSAVVGDTVDDVLKRLDDPMQNGTLVLL